MKKFILLFTVITFISCKTVMINKEATTYADGITYLKQDMSLVNGIVKEYFENGWLSYEGNYKDGKEVGVHKYYYDEFKVGDLASERIFNDGQLVSEKVYYDDNQLWTEGSFKDGKQDGIHKGWYYKSGILEYEQVWKDGEEHGVWKNWNKNDKLIKERNYENGVKTSEKSY